MELWFLFFPSQTAAVCVGAHDRFIHSFRVYNDITYPFLFLLFWNCALFLLLISVLSLRQCLTVLTRLTSKSWTQLISLPQLAEELGPQALTTHRTWPPSAFWSTGELVQGEQVLAAKPDDLMTPQDPHDRSDLILENCSLSSSPMHIHADIK